MARENRFKRDERRFGRSGRLADLAQFTPWLVSPEQEPTLPEQFTEFIRQSTRVDAQNVLEFVTENTEKDWLWTELPSCRLPYPLMFIESPVNHPFSNAFERTGVLISEADPVKAVENVAKALDVTPEGYSLSRLAPDLDRLREKTRYAIDFGMIALLTGSRTVDKYRIVHINRGCIFLDLNGTPLRAPFGQIDKDIFQTLNDVKSAKMFFWESMFPVLLAIGFMNCKNVSLSGVDPDKALNRERRKAGLKPFLRYHTINIEPMKKVLRTEGDIETEGLKRALHICRGHFATYTEEKPLFGRKSGTFWVPAHVRGSAKEGVVVSDYKVSP